MINDDKTRNEMLADVVDAMRNTIREAESAHGKIWKAPIVGTTAADREEFADLRRVVSPTHLLPADVLPGAKSVLYFFVPFDDAIAKGNVGGEFSSVEWASAYIATNELIAAISDAVSAVLARLGYHVGKIPATHNFDETTLLSDWSHRHVAYIAGLGSFGLNNMLITDRGTCGRFGSIVTDYPFGDSATSPVAERCLYKIDGSCGLCRTRCPAGAYANDSYDRHACYRVCLENARQHHDIGYADVCGKCLVALPCSLRDPSSKGDRS
jgi:epoxyqueuosine reductase QueG